MPFSKELIAAPIPSSCTGQIFKGYRTMFFSKGRIEIRQGIRHLKKKSCNCDKCCGVLDAVQEATSDGYLIMPDIIENDAFYGVRFINVSTDWETGYVDSYDVSIYKLEPDTTKEEDNGKN